MANSPFSRAVAQQIHEMDSIRRKLWDLEQNQIQIKKQYVFGAIEIALCLPLTNLF